MNKLQNNELRNKNIQNSILLLKNYYKIMKIVWRKKQGINKELE